MARPGLTKHRKFLRLARAVGNVPLALGCLEMIWSQCYENGEDYLGDAVDVESAAQWLGTPGALCSSLLAAGGDGNSGFIEEIEDRPGHFRCHDLYDHAPEYVRKRMDRENARRAAGVTLREVRAAAANERWRRAKDMQTDASGKHMDASGTTPAPAPAPIPKDTPLPPRGPRGKKVVIGDYPPQVGEAIKAYKTLMKDCQAPEVMNQFPEDKRFIASSIGPTEGVWKAWKNHLGSLVHGSVVTDVDILAAVMRLIQSKGHDAITGKRLAIPMLPTLINSDYFVDALVRVKEISNAS